MSPGSGSGDTPQTPIVGLEREQQAPARMPFSEKGFYLEEFRGRTLGVGLADREQAEHPVLLAVLDELRENHTRVVLVAPAGARLEGLDCEVLPARTERLEGLIWRALRRRERVVVEASEDLFATLLDLAVRLRLFKVIRLAAVPGVQDGEGRRRSFVDLRELGQLGNSGSPQEPILREVERLLAAGISNVNVCTLEGLHDELFTYSGSGTLFTRERYVAVRDLGVDDFDAAHDLIRRGEAEGYLAPRSDEAIDELLAEGCGAFVDGRHLAGVGALRVLRPSGVGEVASLYTLTRYVGAGIGAQLVSFALGRARDLGLPYVFACTTSQRVGDFFRRLEFAAVGQDRVPPEKWRNYDAERRQRVLCFRYDL